MTYNYDPELKDIAEFLPKVDFEDVAAARAMLQQMLEPINAMKLLAAGVPVELHTYPGTFHGSSMIQHAAVSQRIDADLVGAFKRGLKV